MEKLSVDCIIPFYNESGRVLDMIKVALNTHEFRTVICVDDGSSDNFHLPTSYLKNKKLKFLRHPKNLGKTEAIKTGLQYVKTSYVFLIDADLIRLTSSMLSAVIHYTLQHKVDMMIVRRIKTLPTTRVLKLDILVAGERLMRTEHLRKVLENKLTGYELEPAINDFYLKNNKNVVFTTQNLEQYRKIDKVGLFQGISGDLKATRQIIKYTGIGGMWRQIRYFRPKEVKI